MRLSGGVLSTWALFRLWLRHEPETRQPRRLTTWLAAGITTAFALVFATGLADAFVRELIAVPDAAADLGLRWLWVLLPLPALWVVRAYLRGGPAPRAASRLRRRGVNGNSLAREDRPALPSAVIQERRPAPVRVPQRTGRCTPAETFIAE